MVRNYSGTGSAAWADPMQVDLIVSQCLVLPAAWWCFYYDANLKPLGNSCWLFDTSRNTVAFTHSAEPRRAIPGSVSARIRRDYLIHIYSWMLVTGRLYFKGLQHTLKPQGVLFDVKLKYNIYLLLNGEMISIEQHVISLGFIDDCVYMSNVSSIWLKSFRFWLNRWNVRLCDMMCVYTRKLLIRI